MQDINFTLNAILILAFLTFYGTITWGLFRYSTKQSYRLWAFGWFIYSIGGLQSAISAQNLVPLDIVGLICFYIGSTLILDGSRETEFTRSRATTYLIGAMAIALITLLCILLNLPYYVIFGILGIYTAYVCLRSVWIVYGFQKGNEVPKIWLTIGLLVWAISWLIYPLVILLPSSYYDYVVTLQAAGVIITGSSMLTFFMMKVTHNLEQQYQVSQIMSSLIQHDIRNYIQIAQSSLELGQIESNSEGNLIDIATKALDDANLFINEMRDITNLIARVKANYEPTSLLAIVTSVKKRVQQEYSLESDQIRVTISENTTIKICPLFKEILWNIFDNAFKHGSESLHVKEIIPSKSEIILEITDRSGGIPDNIKDFLNSIESLSRPVAPSLGLGIILIRGLSLMCSLRLSVEDYFEGSAIVGTTYRLGINGLK